MHCTRCLDMLLYTLVAAQQHTYTSLPGERRLLEEGGGAGLLTSPVATPGRGRCSSRTRGGNLDT